MALTQRRTISTRGVNNATLAGHIIKEGKFDQRHIPLLDAILSTDWTIRRKGLEQFLENRAHDPTGGNASRPTLFILKGKEHFESPISALRNYRLITKEPDIRERDKYYDPKSINYGVGSDNFEIHKDSNSVDILRHIRQQLTAKKRGKS